jgi:hypothetical protein
MRTQMTLENSSVRSVSIDVIFTATILPSNGASHPTFHFALQHAAGRADVLRLLVIYHNMF